MNGRVRRKSSTVRQHQREQISLQQITDLIEQGLVFCIDPRQLATIVNQ